MYVNNCKLKNYLCLLPTYIFTALKKKGSRILWINFIILSFVNIAIAQQKSSKGKEFWLTFTQCRDDDRENLSATSDPPQLNIFITSQETTLVTITYPSDSILKPDIEVFTINAGGHKISTRYDHRTGWTMASRKENFNTDIRQAGIKVESEKEITVYTQIFQKPWNSTSLILPTISLGSNYIVANNRGVSVRDSSDKPIASHNEFAIVATEDNTVITITPTIRNSYQYKDPFLWRTNPSFQITLNKGEVFNYFAPLFEDVSGTEIKAADCKKIAVFSSADHMLLGCDFADRGVSDVLSGDNLFQQMVPIESWGKKFVVVPFKTRPLGEVKIFGFKENTKVNINGNIITLDKSKRLIHSHKLKVSLENNRLKQEVLNISADEPIGVVYYTYSQFCDKTLIDVFDPLNPDAIDQAPGDPDMMVILPQKQKTNNVILYSANSDISNPNFSNIRNHFINVIIEKNFANTLKINGRAPNGDFVDIPATNLVYLQEDISALARRNIITRIAAQTNFIAYAYGFGDKESYSYLAGGSFATTPIVDLYASNNPSIATNTIENKSTKDNVKIYCDNQKYEIYLKSSNRVETMNIKFLSDKDITLDLPKPDHILIDENGDFHYQVFVSESDLQFGSSFLTITLEYARDTIVECSLNSQTFSYQIQKFEIVNDFDMSIDACEYRVVTFTNNSFLEAGFAMLTWTLEGGQRSSDQTWTVSDLAFIEQVINLSIQDSVGCISNNEKTFLFKDAQYLDSLFNVTNIINNIPTNTHIVCGNGKLDLSLNFIFNQDVDLIYYSINEGIISPTETEFLDQEIKVSDAESEEKSYFINKINKSFITSQTNEVRFYVQHSCASLPQVYLETYILNDLETIIGLFGDYCVGYTFEDRSINTEPTLFRQWELDLPYQSEEAIFSLDSFTVGMPVNLTLTVENQYCQDIKTLTLFNQNLFDIPLFIHAQEGLLCDAKSITFFAEIPFKPTIITWELREEGNPRVLDTKIDGTPSPLTYDTEKQVFIFEQKMDKRFYLTDKDTVIFLKYANTTLSDNCYPLQGNAFNTFRYDPINIDIGVEEFSCQSPKLILTDNTSAVNSFKRFWDTPRNVLTTFQDASLETLIINSVKQLDQYLFTLTIQSEVSPCKKSKTLSITLNNDQIIDFDIETQYDCFSDLLINVQSNCLHDSVSEDILYAWYINDNLIETTDNIFFEIKSNLLNVGINKIGIIQFHKDQIFSFNSKFFEIKSIFNPDFDLSNQSGFCLDEPIVFLNKSTFSENHRVKQMNFIPDVTTPNTALVVFDNTINDTGTINLSKPITWTFNANGFNIKTITSSLEILSNDCQRTIEKTFVFYGKPSFQLLQKDIAFCHNQEGEINFLANNLYLPTRNIQSLQLSIGDQALDSSIKYPYDYFVPNTYEIFYIANNQSCQISESINLNIKEVPAITFKTPIFINQDKGMILTEIDNSSNITYTLRWSENVGLSQIHIQNPEIDLVDGERFTLNVNFQNGCTVETNTVISSYNQEFYNYFSPNNDDKNDLFDFPDIKNYFTIISFQVFDILGSKIYETQGTTWDGRDQFGKIVRQGVYFYQLHLDELETGYLTGYIHVIE